VNHSRRSRVQAANTAPPPEGANRHPLQQITLRVEEAVAIGCLRGRSHLRWWLKVNCNNHPPTSFRIKSLYRQGASSYAVRDVVRSLP